MADRLQSLEAWLKQGLLLLHNTEGQHIPGTHAQRREKLRKLVIRELQKLGPGGAAMSLETGEPTHLEKVVNTMVHRSGAEYVPPELRYA